MIIVKDTFFIIIIFRCFGLIVSPQNMCSGPGTLNVTLFGNRVNANAVKLKSYEIRMGPKTKTGVLIKEGNLDRDTHTEKTRCDDRGKDQSDASVSQGIPRIASNQQKLRKSSFPRTYKENGPANT